MKNTIILILFVLSLSCASQKEDSKVVLQSDKTTQKEEYLFKIKEIISDSRCPENVNCVWAGEVELVLLIFKENSIENEIKLVINTKTLLDNKILLEKYTFGKKIENIEITPSKKQGVEIPLEAYVFKIIFKEN